MFPSSLHNKCQYRKHIRVSMIHGSLHERDTLLLLYIAIYSIVKGQSYTHKKIQIILSYVVRNHNIVPSQTCMSNEPGRQAPFTVNASKWRCMYGSSHIAEYGPTGSKIGYRYLGYKIELCRARSCTTRHSVLRYGIQCYRNRHAATY